MTRVLVTGGTGFIGREVVRELLAHGCDVSVASRQKSVAETSNRIHWLTADLTEPAGVDELFDGGGFEVLVHLAWETRHGYFWDARENLQWVSISNRLLEQFVEQGGRRFVGAGTCVEYAPPSVGPCVEGVTTVAPRHLYGVAKDAFRRLLASYAAQTELEYAWGRIFMLTGPGEPGARLVPQVVTSLLRGERARCSSGTQLRDFLDVRDSAAALASLALSDYVGELNVCSGQPVSIGEIIEEIGSILGAKELLGVGELPDRPYELPNLWGSRARVEKELGFTPRRTLRESLEDSVAWWKGQLR